MFMRPNIVQGKFDFFQDEWGTTQIMPSEYAGDEPDSWEHYDTIDAFFARLSAPGYLDSTDWMGPFDSEHEALIELFDLYGSFDENIKDWEDEVF